MTIYHFDSEKTMAGRKTNFLIALLTKKKISLLVNISITLKVTKMRRNEPPFALRSRTKAAIVLGFILLPFYVYIARQNEKQKESTVNDIEETDTVNVADSIPYWECR